MKKRLFLIWLGVMQAGLSKAYVVFCGFVWLGCISYLGQHKILFGWLYCSMGYTVVARLGLKLGQLGAMQPAQPETIRTWLFAQPEPS